MLARGFGDLQFTPGDTGFESTYDRGPPPGLLPASDSE